MIEHNNSHFICEGKSLIHTTKVYRIRKRGEHRCWEVEFQNAKNVWRSTGTKELDEVEGKVSIMLMQEGKDTVTGMTFREFAKNFFLRDDKYSIRKHNEMMKKFYDDGWYESNQGRLNNYIMPMFGNIRMDEITDVMIEDWYISLNSFSNKDRSLSDNSKVKVLQAMKHIMKEAKRRRVIGVNPCDTVERIEQEHKARGFFTLQEISIMFPSDRMRLLNIWGSLQMALFFSIMVDTGWRCGEVSALRKQNFINGGIYSTSSVNYRTGEIKNSIKTTKKGQDYKVGILSDYTISLYTDFVKTWERDELFYLESQGRMNRPDASNYVLKRALEFLGIPVNDRTGHCIRHSFDTYMLKNTGDFVSHEDVLELMAHTSYRPEYDHRDERDMIERLSKAKPLLNNIRMAK